MSQHTKTGLGILAAAIALGALGDFLLRPAPWGAGVMLWIGALVWALYALAQGLRVPLTGGGRWLVAPALLFAAAFAWHDSPTMNALNLLALLTALAIAARRSRAGRVRIAGLSDYFRAQIAAAGNALFGVLSLILGDIQWRTVPRRGWSVRALAVTRGLMIGLPLVFIFGGLFAAADAVFENFATRLLNWDVEALATSLIYIGGWAWVSAGFLRQSLLALEATAGKPASYSIGPVEMMTALGLLNALFLAFVLVQLRYFFGGADIVRSTVGLTYAEYARRGFFELVTVAALVLPLLLIAHWLLPKEDWRAERFFRLFAGSLIGLLFVIMVSAVQRMGLYQQEFGLTELRVYTTAFMGWLAAVFAWFVATVLRGRRERFAFGALVAGFAAIAGLHALNPDDLIVRVNTSRVHALNPFDEQYVTVLSADAVPALVGVLPSMPEADRCYLAAQIVAKWSAPSSVDWRTWNFSRVQAWQIVDANRQKLLDWACASP